MKKVFILILFVTSTFALQVDHRSVLFNHINAELHVNLSDDVKCGTPAELFIHENIDNIDPKIYQNYLEQMRIDSARQRSFTTPSGNFRLHWDESGPNSVPEEDISGNGYPDYIDSAVVILEKVREIEVNELGYQAPPAQDGSAAKPYLIYFSALDSLRIYGLTHPSWIDIPNLPGVNYTSWIELDNNYTDSIYRTQGLDGLRVTAAHEYHHAIQLGYYYRFEDRYFLEMTSTWMEEVIYPDINDYLNYLDEFFYYVSNTQFDYFGSLYPYGNSIYLQMLEKQFGKSIVRDIWNKMIVMPSLPSIMEILDENNGSWLTSLSEYGLWLYYTGDRAISGQFFTDARHFPQIRIYASDKIEFNEVFSEDWGIGPLANRYMQFRNVKGLLLNIEVASEGIPPGGFRTMTPGSYSIFRPLNQAIFNEPLDADTMVMVITNSQYENMMTTINMTIGGEIDPVAIYPFPNPVNSGMEESLRFLNVPTDASLYIYNLRGRRIASVEKNGNSMIRAWNFQNDLGDQVAAGVYVFIVKGDGLLKKGKFSILR